MRDLDYSPNLPFSHCVLGTSHFPPLYPGPLQSAVKPTRLQHHPRDPDGNHISKASPHLLRISHTHKNDGSGILCCLWMGSRVLLWLLIEVVWVTCGDPGL